MAYRSFADWPSVETDDDGRVVAGAEVPADAALGGAARKRRGAKDVIDAPTDVALPGVLPVRPPREEVPVRGSEGADHVDKPSSSSSVGAGEEPVKKSAL